MAAVHTTRQALPPATLAPAQPGRARALAVPLAGLAVLLLRSLAIVALLSPLLLAIAWLLG